MIDICHLFDITDVKSLQTVAINATPVQHLCNIFMDNTFLFLECNLLQPQYFFSSFHHKLLLFFLTAFQLTLVACVPILLCLQRNPLFYHVLRKCSLAGALDIYHICHICQVLQYFSN